MRLAFLVAALSLLVPGCLESGSSEIDEDGGTADRGSMAAAPAADAPGPVDESGREEMVLQGFERSFSFEVGPNLRSAEIRFLVTGATSDVSFDPSGCVEWSYSWKAPGQSVKSNGQEGDFCSGGGIVVQVEPPTLRPETYVILDWTAADLRPGHYSFRFTTPGQPNTAEWVVRLDQ